MSDIYEPLLLSTWPFGLNANQAAWSGLMNSGSALSAVEQGIRQVEQDPEVHSVGLGAYPDRDGHITVDAGIMAHNGNCGSVTFLEGILHPVSIARQVMEQSAHVMLSGEGALQFALAQGFTQQELRTEFSRRQWEAWKRHGIDAPLDMHNHDTIGMLALDRDGHPAGACSTSGMAFKEHGRVGDSPIVGAGLFVDGNIGAATATGVGEVIMKVVGSFAIVELMRRGASPQDACAEVALRTLKQVPEAKEQPAYFIALNRAGNFGAWGTHQGFVYAVSTQKQGHRLLPVDGELPAMTDPLVDIDWEDL